MSDSSIIKKLAKNVRIGNGTCPNGHSLMSKDKLFDGEKSLMVHARSAGQSGMLYMNPFYGRFEYDCEFVLNKGDIVELLCPECEVNLEIDIMCKLCNIPMFAIQLPDGGQVEACPTIGCHNHSLKIVDLDEQLERMYVDETKVQM